MKRLLPVLAWLIAALFAAVTVHATEVKAFLDRDSVDLGESVTLNVQVTDNVNADAPDFSVLVPDFVLGGTSRSQNISISNGRVTKTQLFAVSLKPRHQGTLTIPALDVNGARTEPLQLTVLPPDSQASGAPGDPVFIRTELDPDTLYVGQQASLTVRLYYDGASLQGQLDDPDSASAEVTQIGKQTQYQTQVGGQPYRVVERHYALVPKQPGQLAIPPLNFRGRLISDGGSFGGFFGNAHDASAHSPPITAVVHAPPPAAGTPWLPARSFKLEMSGLPDNGKATVGTPITLTLTEQAEGLAYETLPEPTLPDIPGAEVYPDKTQGRTGDNGEWLQGTRVRKFAIVPTRPGTLTLPPISVDWWDVGHDQAATASVPAHTLDVSGAAMPSGAASTAPAPAHSVGVPSAAAGRAQAAAAAPGTASGHGFWRALALAALGLWGLTVIAWAWSLRRRQHARAAHVSTQDSPDASAAACRRAFRKADDARTQARTLLDWARTERPGVRNLGDVARLLRDADQRALIARLEQARFAEGLRAPEPRAVHKAFRDGFAWRASPGPTQVDGLPPLYPER